MAKPVFPADFPFGQTLASGRACCVSEDGVDQLNEGLRGNWFNERQVFFARGIGDDVPDYFDLDLDDPEPRPVQYFHLTPTEMGRCASTLQQFLDGEWQFTTSRGPSMFG